VRRRLRELRDRLTPAQLRWRLAGWVALVTLVCTAIVFVTVYSGTGSQLRKQIDFSVNSNALELSRNLVLAGARTPKELSETASGYVRSRPFRASPNLMFVLVGGHGAITNRPELLGHREPDADQSARQVAEERLLAHTLLQAPLGYSTLDVPTFGDLRLLKRRVQISRGLRATVGVGESLTAVGEAKSSVARAFVLAGLLALAGALLAAYLIGTRMSRPMRRMAAVAARVNAGDLHPRIRVQGRRSDEVRELANAFDHMLDRLTEAFASQRAFVADASHELRTPLTVIRGQLEVLAADDQPPGSEVRRVERLVQAEIARISRLVDDLLLLAKAENTEFLRPEPVDLEAFVGELWDGTSLLAERRFELAAVPAGTLMADPDRLAQALRNLLSNAIDQTRAPDGLIRLSVLPSAQVGGLRFVVDDDGPGIPPAQRERVFDRFHRTDSARDRASGGTGLGLAISRAIADAHGGLVRADASPEGGARVELELPGFAQADAAVTAHGQAVDASAGTAQAPAVGGAPVAAGRR
jgi:two-component system, OmpR family, sensor kinase